MAHVGDDSKYWVNSLRGSIAFLISVVVVGVVNKPGGIFPLFVLAAIGMVLFTGAVAFTRKLEEHQEERDKEKEERDKEKEEETLELHLKNLDSYLTQVQEGDREAKLSALDGIESLGRKCGKKAGPALVSALEKTSDGDIRRRIAKALRTTSTSSEIALPTLLQLLDDDEEETKGTAFLELKFYDGDSSHPEYLHRAALKLWEVAEHGQGSETRSHAKTLLNLALEGLKLKPEFNPKPDDILQMSCFNCEKTFKVKGEAFRNEINCPACRESLFVLECSLLLEKPKPMLKPRPDESLRMKCFNCHKTLKVKGTAFGQKIDCPVCKEPLLVVEEFLLLEQPKSKASAKLKD